MRKLTPGLTLALNRYDNLDEAEQHRYMLAQPACPFFFPTHSQLQPTCAKVICTPRVLTRRHGAPLRFTRLAPDDEVDRSREQLKLLEFAMQIRKLSGKRVRVDSLSTKPELNGCLGNVCSTFAGMGRCAVLVDGHRKNFSLRHDALEDVDEDDGDDGAEFPAASKDSKGGSLSMVKPSPNSLQTLFIPRTRDRSSPKPHGACSLRCLTFT